MKSTTILRLSGLCIVTGFLSGCAASADGGGSEDASAPTAPSGSDASSSPSTGQDGAAPPTGSLTPDSGPADGASQGADAAPPVSTAACNQEPPTGAVEAPALPTYAGTCPQLAMAPNLTTFTSSGVQRSFMVVVPSNLQPNERLPVIVAWYWLGGSAMDFYSNGDLQTAADTQRFIAIIPQDLGDLQYRWPFTIEDSDARMNQEFQFFDDMLACVAHQYPTVNKNCVGSVGVSAGALFTDQLGSARANRLSSILSISGGVGGVVRGWSTPAHKLPALVMWGGPTDDCLNVLDFQTMSQTLEGDLTSEGSFLLECIHNCGHGVPPINAPSPTKFAPLWDFVFDHPFWLAAGQSPYKQTGLPAAYPSWCAIGEGKATIRTGACGPSGC